MTDKINGRMPEEIKELLACCYGDTKRRLCEKCPNAIKVESYPMLVCKDFDAAGECALALIQQLEAERDQYKRERDAAVKELRRTHNCNICKHHKKSGGTCDGWSVCGYNIPSWEWRGVQGEVE